MGILLAMFLCLYQPIIQEPLTIIEQETVQNVEHHSEQREIQYDVLHKKNYDNREMLAQLVMAEAGNQDLTGKRLVACVVLNRVQSDIFPDSIEEVIQQEGQFTVIDNGSFASFENRWTEECLEAVNLEFQDRSDQNILYFSKGKSKYMKHKAYKHQDHWFGY